MAQLNPDRYKRLTKPLRYAISDGLYYDNTDIAIVAVTNDTITAKIPLTQTSGTALISDGTDVEPTAISNDATLSGAGALTMAATSVEASMLGANLAKGHIPLDIFTARLISANAIQNTTEGGVPDGNTAPLIARVNGATDKQGRLAWAAAGVEEIQFAPISYPGDLDDTAAVTVHFLAAMAGATDTPVLTVGYFEGVGDADAGGATGAVTGTVVTEYTRTIAAGDIGAHPKSATITVTPAAHGTDILYVYAAWLEFTRKT